MPSGPGTQSSRGPHSTHEQHAHMHGAECGHQAIQHGDHTDYLHNGHRHASHEGHWDEHEEERSR